MSHSTEDDRSPVTAIPSAAPTASPAPVPPVVALVRRRPLTSFFTLAFALSWLAWTPYVLSAQGLGLLPWHFPTLLGTTQLAGVLPGAYLGPLGAAWLVTRLADGPAGVRVWLGRITRWRVGWRWWVGVVVAVPVVLVVGGVVLDTEDRLQFPPAAVLLLYVPMLLLQVVTTGLAEEPGWRDFALPRMQPRFGPVRGTVILGFLWGLWHLPLFLTEWGGWPNVRPADVIAFVLGAVAFSIVMTWVFNRTGQSLPVAIVLHAGVNTFFSLAWTPVFGEDGGGHSTGAVLLVASAMVATVLLVVTRGCLGYEPAARERAAHLDTPADGRVGFVADDDGSTEASPGPLPRSGPGQTSGQDVVSEP